MATTIILVDDHKVVRDGFRKIIETEPAYQVVGSYASVEQTIASEHILDVDVLITDIQLEGESTGFEIVAYLTQRNPKCQCLLLSMHESSLYLQRARSLGVDGFINKRDASQTLLEALSVLADGGKYFSNDFKNKLLSADDALKVYNELHPREKEVFLLLARGFEVKRIAHVLDIETKTVYSHRRNLFIKFNFFSSFDVTKFALKHGIILPQDL